MPLPIPKTRVEFRQASPRWRVGSDDAGAQRRGIDAGGGPEIGGKGRQAGQDTVKVFAQHRLAQGKRGSGDHAIRAEVVVGTQRLRLDRKSVV